MSKRSTMLGEHLRIRDREHNLTERELARYWAGWWGKLALLTVVPALALFCWLAVLVHFARWLDGK